jgi:hypothetical protein
MGREILYTLPSVATAFMQDEEAYINTKSLTPNNRSKLVWYWIAFTSVNLLFASISVFNQFYTSRTLHGPIWDTDMLDARSAISYEERTYTGSLTYDYDKKEMIREADSNMEFFGPPGPEVDAAWHSLLRGKCVQ